MVIVLVADNNRFVTEFHKVPDDEGLGLTVKWVLKGDDGVYNGVNE